MDPTCIQASFSLDSFNHQLPPLRACALRMGWHAQRTCNL